MYSEHRRRHFEHRVTLWGFLALSCVACGSTSGTPYDAAAADSEADGSNVVDAGRTDGDAVEGGTVDAGLPEDCGPVSEGDVPTGFDVADVRVVAIDPNDEDRLFAGTLSGVYRSEDGGRTWAFWGLRGYEVEAVAVTEGATVLAGTQGRGVYRRNLAGDDSWGESWSGAERPFVTDIVAGTASPSTLFASAQRNEYFPDTDGAVYRSDDHGMTWRVVFDYGTVGRLVGSRSPREAAWIEDIELDPSMPGRVWIAFSDADGATPYGGYRSDDGGATWSIVESLGGHYLEAIRVASWDSAVLYAHGGARPLVSRDGGEDFAVLESPFERAAGIELATSAGGYEAHFGAYDATGVFSVDAAGEFRHVEAPILARTLARTSSHLFAGWTGGLWASEDDGASWVRSGDGMDGVSVQALSRTASHVLIGTHVGLYRHEVGGSAVVEKVEGGLPPIAHVTAIDVADTGTILVAQDSRVFRSVEEGSAVYRSDDQGASWIPAGDGIPLQYEVHAMAVLSGVHYVFGSNGTSTSVPVYVSEDPGTVAWRPRDDYPFAAVFDIAAGGDPVEETVFVGGFIGEAGIFELDATGGVRAVHAAGMPDFGQPWAVAHRSDPWLLGVGAVTGLESGGIYTKEAADDAFERSASGLPSGESAFAWELYAHGDGSLLAGFARASRGADPRELGVYRRSPTGIDWERMTAGAYPDVVVIASDPVCVDRVYVGTLGQGVERLHLDDD